MSKFKHGDKVVCVQESKARGVVLGGRYTINNPDWSPQVGCHTRVELLELPDASPLESRFELAIQDEPVAEHTELKLILQKASVHAPDVARYSNSFSVPSRK